MPEDLFAPITRTDHKIGVEYSVTPCEDRSGFVCRIIDFYTGVILGTAYGSDREMTLTYAAAQMHGRPVSLILSN